MFSDDGLFIRLRSGGRRRRPIAEWGVLARALLEMEAINTDKAMEAREWEDERILLRFSANKSAMAISLPEGKRAVATIPSDEMFGHLGSRVRRLITTQRIRGNIERCRSSNMIWSFSTGPIDALMCFADESNTWTNCGSRHVWYAFWSSANIIRIIRLVN